MLGRTATEVVQFSVICYPFQFRVVRTITIERTETGTVVRRDGGWRAASNGMYGSTAVTTHPGVVQGVFNIRNIRDLGMAQSVDSSTTAGAKIELSAVQFDCDVGLENIVSGQGPSGLVPAHDFVGYALKTPGGDLTPPEYSQLITSVGPLGGVVDAAINIGSSGQKMRISQVGVGVSLDDSGNNPQFIMTAWGLPIFPPGGEWSFLITHPGDLAPSAIGSGGGIPLIRENASTAPGAPTSPYEFADPSTLLNNSSSTVYGICHATPTQRLLFQKPVIGVETPFAITSTVPPYLADPFVLATTTGVFPLLKLCIQFNDANYKLLISPSGDLSLTLPGAVPPSTFTANPDPRTLVRTGMSEEILSCVDDTVNPPNASQITITIDTSNRVTPWSLKITNLTIISNLVTSSLTSTEVSRVIGDVVSLPNTPSSYNNTNLVFGPVLQPVKKAMSFLEMFGPLAPLTVSMTNKWSIFANLSIDLNGMLKKVPGIASFLKTIFQTLKFDFVRHTDAWVTYSDMQFTLRIKIPIVGVWIFTILGKFTYHIGTDGHSYLLQLGGGVGASVNFGPFNVFAAIEVTVDGVMGDNAWGVGGSVIISANINFVVVSVSTSIEARQLFMVTSCPTSKDTTWGLTQVLVAVDISLFLVCNIDFHYQTEWDQVLNGGKCPLSLAGAINVGRPE